MQFVRSATRFVYTLIFVVAAASVAEAQATRTWVSGVGDDVNPCSRTAPCKTFAGAISKTAAGGEIDALDPGGFGTITITKSMTIDGGTGAGWASILASSTNGVTVNAASTDVVTLRNLSINGAGTGVKGIRYLAAAQLNVQNVQIFGFTNFGIEVALASGATGRLEVDNCNIHNNGATHIAIFPPTGQPSVTAVVTNSNLTRSTGGAGVFAGEGARVTIRDSALTLNAGSGVFADGSVVPGQITVERSDLSFNGTGATANTATSVVRLSETVITGNATNGVAGGAAVVSFGNNRIAGNAGNNGAGMTVIGQQ